MHTDDCSPVYNVKVVDAQDLAKEDADIDFLFWTKVNNNDPFVDVYGYVSNNGLVGTDYQKVTTSTQDNTASPVWEEEFKFDEGNLNDAEFVAFKFMLYDDDSVLGIGGADYLGETDYFYTKDIKDCNDVYSERMNVNRGGTLFVEISMDSCCDAVDDGNDKGEKDKK